jgi:hypothetical protein
MSLLPPLKPSELGEARLMLAAGLVELAAVFAIVWCLSTRRACQLVALLGGSFLIVTVQV